MLSSSDIQKSIDSEIQAKASWNTELMALNKSLASAKKITEKRRLKDAIKNAEDQIKDLDRSISRLSNDLRRVAIVEEKSVSKNLLAEQGLTKAGIIAKEASNIVEDLKPILSGTENGSLATRKSTFATNEQSEKTPINKNYIYIAIGIIVLLLFTKK